MKLEKEHHFIGLKLLSAFSIGCIGSGQMFLPIFYKKVLGLGNDKIGFIFSITPFVSFIAFPYWTSLIDKTGKYREIMIRNMLIALLCILFIGLVPYLSNTEWIQIALTSMGCFGYAFFGYPIIAALVDTVILRVLAHRKDLYGRQKIGVPIGFATSVFLTGFLTEKLDSLYALFIVFTVYCLGFVITLAVVDINPHYYEPVETGEEVDDTYGSMSPNNNSVEQATAVVIEDVNDGICATPDPSMWHLLQEPEAIQFFTFMTTMGFAIAVVQAFLYLFMENDLHASSFLVGLFGPLGSITEIIVFFFFKQVLHRLGARRMLAVAQCIIVYRCLTYIVCARITWGAYLATATQVLHGVGFSMTWSAAALQADQIAPPDLKSRAQGLLNMAFNGLGSGIGALVGGFIYERWGSTVMWAVVAALAAVSIVLYTSNFVLSIVFLPLSNLVKRYTSSQ
ncbi:FK506-binding protein 5 [Mucor velutinosus]|uniref:FK506-binding protein 5 n=1 Tax=Mucor velutinosus TaxID=708070 RepID=A0AAN7DI61_9FUNG|nr:FK506-binding protein 5 [Mucor velutinosus]